MKTISRPLTHVRVPGARAGSESSTGHLHRDGARLEAPGPRIGDAVHRVRAADDRLLNLGDPNRR